MTNELPPLEISCPECKGAGSIASRQEGNVTYQGGPCNCCRGAKWMPTEAGLQIIRLIQHERQKGNF